MRIRADKTGRIVLGHQPKYLRPHGFGGMGRSPKTEQCAGKETQEGVYDGRAKLIGSTPSPPSIGKELIDAACGGQPWPQENFQNP